MRKYFTNMSWGMLVVLILVSAAGCSFFDHAGNSPTAPAGVTPASDHLANFWVIRGGDKFSVYTSGDLLRISAPEGAYLVTYTVKTVLEEADGEEDGTGAEDISGEFYILFKVPAGGAYLHIGLKPGDQIWTVSVKQVQILLDDQEAIRNEGGVLIFVLPENQNEFDLDQILIVLPFDDEADDDGEDELDLIDDGEVEEGMETEKYLLTTEVNDPALGSVEKSTIRGIPHGSSRSIKIIPTSGEFDDILDVIVKMGNSEVSVIDDVQELGNGQGHLVIHGITDDVHIIVTFAEPAP